MIKEFIQYIDSLYPLSGSEQWYLSWALLNRPSFDQWYIEEDLSYGYVIRCDPHLNINPTLFLCTEGCLDRATEILQHIKESFVLFV